MTQLLRQTCSEWSGRCIANAAQLSRMLSNTSRSNHGLRTTLSSTAHASAPHLRLQAASSPFLCDMLAPQRRCSRRLQRRPYVAEEWGRMSSWAYKGAAARVSGTGSALVGA